MEVSDGFPSLIPYRHSHMLYLNRCLTWIFPRTRIDKVNAELVTLTYGTIVTQLCSDYDSKYEEVNKQLDKMGYNIGMRLVEDFFARSGAQRCLNFRDTAEAISKVSNAGQPPSDATTTYTHQSRLGHCN